MPNDHDDFVKILADIAPATPPELAKAIFVNFPPPPPEAIKSDRFAQYFTHAGSAFLEASVDQSLVDYWIADGFSATPPYAYPSHMAVLCRNMAAYFREQQSDTVNVDEAVRMGPFWFQHTAVRQFKKWFGLSGGTAKNTPMP